jgi:hypothetical protein
LIFWVTIQQAVIAMHIEKINYALAAHMLKRAMGFQPHILLKFVIFLRSRDLDEEIGEQNTKKSIFKALSRGKRAQVQISQYSKMFWKIVVNHKEFTAKEYSQLSKLAYLIHSSRKECDRIFSSLIQKYPKDITVIRTYAQYLERVKHEETKAALMYEEADDIEEIEQDRAAQRRRVMALENYRITSRRSMESRQGSLEATNPPPDDTPRRQSEDIELEEITPDIEQLDGTVGPPTMITIAEETPNRTTLEIRSPASEDMITKRRHSDHSSTLRKRENIAKYARKSSIADSGSVVGNTISVTLSKDTGSGSRKDVRSTSYVRY